MDLFKAINEMLGEGCTLSLTIAKKGENLTVSVLPGNNLVKDGAKNSFNPLNISGTPDELDEGFITVIKEPVQRVCGMLVDMASFEKGEEEAKAKSQMLAKQKEEKENKIKSFQAYIALAKTNLEQDKFKDAKTCLETAKSFNYDEKCDKQINEVKAQIESKSGAGSIFGAKEDKSDGKNVKVSSASLKNQQPSPMKSENDEEDSENDD